jgi:hypothetical protein
LSIFVCLSVLLISFCLSLFCLSLIFISVRLFYSLSFFLCLSFSRSN